MIVIAVVKARQEQTHAGKSYRYPKWKMYYYDENGTFRTNYLKDRLDNNPGIQGSYSTLTYRSIILG